MDPVGLVIGSVFVVGGAALAVQGRKQRDEAGFPAEPHPGSGAFIL